MSDRVDLPDPRQWPAKRDAPADAVALHRRVLDRLATGETAATQIADAAIDAVLATWIGAGDGAALSDAFACAPAADVYRHLWRRLAAIEAAVLVTPTLAVVLFALPVIVVTGRETPGEAASVPGVLGDAASIVALLRERGALAADARAAISPSLASADALELRALPALVAGARAMLAGAAQAPLALAPAPIVVEDSVERAHLRFLVGAALCAPQADPLGDLASRQAGMPLTRALSRELATAGASVLALPGRVDRLVASLAAGRAAQRAVALELFAGNALRRLRASYGEPTAVVSAHSAPDAPGGGELRVSLSSPFAPREAQGFRYPLQPYERVPDAVNAIAALLRDCRVSDVRVVPGLQADRDPGTGLLRFCRPEDGASSLH